MGKRKRFRTLGGGLGAVGAMVVGGWLLTATPPVEAASTTSGAAIQPVVSPTAGDLPVAIFTDIAKAAIKGAVTGGVATGLVAGAEAAPAGAAAGAVAGAAGELATEAFDVVTEAASSFVSNVTDFTEQVSNGLAAQAASEGALCGLGMGMQTGDFQASSADQAQAGQMEAAPAEAQGEQDAANAVAQEEEAANQDEVAAADDAAAGDSSAADAGSAGSILNPRIFPGLAAFLGRNHVFTAKNFQFLAFAPNVLDFIGGDARSGQLITFLNPSVGSRSAAHRIEAESFDVSSGFVRTGSGAMLTQSLGSIGFTTVDFGPISGAVQTAHVRLLTPLGLGGRLDLHLDSASGPTIASFLTGGGPANFDVLASVLPTSGKHNLYLNVTQVTSLSQPATVDWVEFLAPPLRPTLPAFSSFCMFAQDTLRLDDRVKLSAAAPVQVANSGHTLTDLGTDVVVGNVYSCAPTNLRERSQVTSFVRSEELITMQNSTKIGGSAIQNSSLNIVPVKLIATVPTSKVPIVSPEPGQTLTLAPGNYTNLDVKSGATVKVSAGTYYFDALTLEPQSIFSVNSGSGRVIVYVGNSLTMRSTVFSATGQTPDFVLGYLGTSAVSISSPFTGTLFAPSAAVSLESLASGNHSGAFFAGSLTVHQGNAVQCRPFADVGKFLAAR